MDATNALNIDGEEHVPTHEEIDRRFMRDLMLVYPLAFDEDLPSPEVAFKVWGVEDAVKKFCAGDRCKAAGSTDCTRFAWLMFVFLVDKQFVRLTLSVP